MVRVFSDVLVVPPSELLVIVVFVLEQYEPGILQLMPTPPSASRAGSCAIADVGNINAGNINVGRAHKPNANNRFILSNPPK